MSKTYSFFTVLITIQLFYSFAVTLLTYAFTKMGIGYTYILTENGLVVASYQEVAQKVQSGLQLQTNIPLIDLGALIFYSGNLIVDLMMNFFTAIPSMVTFLLNIFFTFFNVATEIQATVKLFVYSLITIYYVLNLILFLLNLRTRGGIIA